MFKLALFITAQIGSNQDAHHLGERVNKLQEAETMEYCFQ